MANYDVGAIINLLYKAQVNLRFQNHPETGFYGTLPYDQIFYRGLKPQDFMQPKKDVFHISCSPVLEMKKWYLSKSLKNLCNFFIKEISREIPQILQYIERDEFTNLEHILKVADLQGHRFIIESTWDWGYDVFLLKKNVDICEQQRFSSYEANEIAEWIDVEMNSHVRNSPLSVRQLELGKYQ